jgi:hypothetical protein
VQFSKVACVRAICGKICEDASILYHTTCCTCFACYKKTFKNPESFRRFIAAAENDDLQDDNEEEHLGGAASTSIDEEVDVVAPVSNMDSAIMCADMVKKRRVFIKKLTLAQCEIENSATANGVHYVKVVSAGGIPLTKLLLSNLQLFCATHKISVYRQKKKEEVSQLIAARVALDSIYASIGRLGMTHPI